METGSSSGKQKAFRISSKSGTESEGLDDYEALRKDYEQALKISCQLVEFVGGTNFDGRQQVKIFILIDLFNFKICTH